MSVNGIPSAAIYETAANTTTATAAKEQTSKKSDSAKADTTKTDTKNTQTTTAAVYEKSKETTNTSSTSKIYKPNTDLVKQLKAEADQRNQQFVSLVHNMMKKQGIAYTNSNDMYSLLRNGKLNVDSATAAQAKADIGEDGYWGVEKTSDRLFSFAQALSGGDPEKADKMIAAVKKGFEQATKSWGGKLPDICQQTLDATIEKFNNWKNSNNTTEPVEA